MLFLTANKLWLKTTAFLFYPSILITFSCQSIYNKNVKVKGGFDYVTKT